MNQISVPTPRLYVELKPRLSVVQFVLHGNLKTFSATSIEKDILTVHVPTHGKKIYKFTDFTVDTLSCSGLDVISSSEMQWRMTLTSLFGKSINKTMQIEENDVQAKSTQSHMMETLQQGGIVLKCQSCGKRLFCRESPFSKVLPLPSDSWREVAENWFCHKEKDDAPDLNRLKPRPDEVLLGETDFYMALMKKSIHGFCHREETGDITCGGCKRVLGSGYSEGDMLFTEIFLHSVIILPLKGTDDALALTPCQSCEVLFSRLLINQAQTYTSFRFVVESKVNGKFKPFILVWLMDRHAFLGSPKQQSSNSIKFIPVIKILYQGCVEGRNKESSEMWSKDLTVHSIEVPSSMCLQILSSLIESTKEMPPSLRSLNGFHVGFLRR